MDQNTKLFIDLPPDILFRIFGECDVLDILSLSSACKQLQRVVDEHQVWLDQARRLRIPIPPGTAPRKAKLKGWVISRTRAEVCWTKPRPGNLALHSFEHAGFVGAHLIPGGEFVVILYRNGTISLNRIVRFKVIDALDLQEIARHKEPDLYGQLYYWSRLLTETSYGCPVLVLGKETNWKNPSVFLINPISRVIEKKHQVQCDFDDHGASRMHRILAMKDSMFFICEGEMEARITVATGLGPGQVIRRFDLYLPMMMMENYWTINIYARYYLVSENGLVVTNYSGIYLYHIPELGVAGDGSTLVPIWVWEGDASEYRGTFYKTASPYPALWLQGEQVTHTLEFYVDENGCSPVVVNHHIVEGRPAYCVGDHLKLKGRKVMGINVGPYGETVFMTGVYGKPGLTRRLHTKLPGVFGPGLDQYGRHRPDEVKYADLDEATGRIMVVIGAASDRVPYVQRLCLADLPI